jgi:hypothetical protein
MTTLGGAFGLMGAPLGGGAAAPPILPRLTFLSLGWFNAIDEPLTPLARLTQLTALKLSGYVIGGIKAGWLPPNLKELFLGITDDELTDAHLYGIGGPGWLAALHAGACPKLRALHLNQLAVRDVCAAGPERGLSLGDVLIRLTALETLVATAAREEEDHPNFPPLRGPQLFPFRGLAGPPAEEGAANLGRAAARRAAQPAPLRHGVCAFGPRPHG